MAKANVTIGPLTSEERKNLKYKLESLKLGLTDIESLLKSYITNETIEKVASKGKAYYYLAELSKIKGDPETQVYYHYKAAAEYFEIFGSLKFLSSPQRLISYEWYKSKKAVLE
jgi:hypothetical protein